MARKEQEKLKDIRRRAGRVVVDARHEAWLNEQRFFLRDRELPSFKIPSRDASSEDHAAARTGIALSPSVNTSSGLDSSENPDEKDYRKALNHECIGIQQWTRYRHDYRFEDTTPVLQTPFAFMKLPSELASKILKLLLARNNRVQQLPAGCSTTSYQRVPIDTRLFSVSHAIKAVAEEPVFSHNQFVIHLSNLLPIFVLQSLNGKSFYQIRLIPRLHIYCKPAAKHGVHADGMAAGQDTLANALALCKRLRGTILINTEDISEPSTVFADNIYPLTWFDKLSFLLIHIEEARLRAAKAHLGL